MWFQWELLQNWLRNTSTLTGPSEHPRDPERASCQQRLLHSYEDKNRENKPLLALLLLSKVSSEKNYNLGIHNLFNLHTYILVSANDKLHF